ncbi:hypothetical protein ACFYP4_09150 [Streptomyces sp. NPDC005551]|uniref:hypothetical protein n=1 Tax=Streptomyces sp. NPDC005551 TaxID=3364725 RepID=UPI0036D11A4C
MGVDVLLMQVRREGTSSKRHHRSVLDSVPDYSDVFAELCENSGKPMLSRVNRYGSLLLTSQDMPQFITEVDGVRSGVVVAEQAAVLDEIGRLARRCGEDGSLELHLEGD